MFRALARGSLGPGLDDARSRVTAQQVTASVARGPAPVQAPARARDARELRRQSPSGRGRAHDRADIAAPADPRTRHHRGAARPPRTPTIFPQEERDPALLIPEPV